MKKLSVWFITFYQLFISPSLKQFLGVQAFCRYSPTCSEYTKQMILKYGIIKGSVLGLKRLSTCHPYAKSKMSNGKYPISNDK